jgi:hypothetical protein
LIDVFFSLAFFAIFLVSPSEHSPVILPYLRLLLILVYVCCFLFSDLFPYFLFHPVPPSVAITTKKNMLLPLNLPFLFALALVLALALTLTLALALILAIALALALALAIACLSVPPPPPHLLLNLSCLLLSSYPDN